MVRVLLCFYEKEQKKADGSFGSMGGVLYLLARAWECALDPFVFKFLKRCCRDVLLMVAPGCLLWQETDLVALV